MSRVNTFGKKILVDKVKQIYHPPHEYTDLLQNIYHHDFLESAEYRKFQRENNGTTIGYSIFKRGATRCPCIQAPSMRVCVDEVETEFAELLHSVKKYYSKHQDRCKCSFCSARHDGRSNALSGNIVIFYCRYCDNNLLYILLLMLQIILIHCQAFFFS